jgi:hypothetical protein
MGQDCTLYNYTFPKTKESSDKEETFYAVLDSDFRNYFLHIVGSQSNNFVKCVLSKNLFRKFCFSNDLIFSRMDLKAIVEIEGNKSTNRDNFGSLQDALQKKFQEENRKPIDLYFLDSSVEFGNENEKYLYADQSPMNRRGTTMYLHDKISKRRIYNFIDSRNFINYELKQATTDSISPYNKIYRDFTKDFSLFVSLMEETFVKEFSLLVEHDLTKKFLFEILRKVKTYNILLRYEFQPELEAQPLTPLLVHNESALMLETELSPILTILYNFCQLTNFSGEVKFCCNEVLELLGWQSTVKTRSLIEKSLYHP